MADRQLADVPTEKELDQMLGAPSFNGECQVLCNDLLEAIDELQDAKGIQRLRIMARIRALRSRMRELHCAACLPS